LLTLAVFALSPSPRRAVAVDERAVREHETSRPKLTSSFPDESNLRAVQDRVGAVAPPHRSKTHTDAVTIDLIARRAQGSSAGNCAQFPV
jgi:hypothetical protein